MFSTSNLVFRFQNTMDYLKNVNIKKDRNLIFFHGIFFVKVHPSKSPAWSGNSKSLKTSEIRPRDVWKIDLKCSGILRPIQLYLQIIVTVEKVWDIHNILDWTWRAHFVICSCGVTRAHTYEEHKSKLAICKTITSTVLNKSHLHKSGGRIGII